MPKALQAKGLPMPERIISSGSLTARYSLIRTGRYVTLVPHSWLPFGPHRSMFKVLALELPAWHRPTMILTLKGRTLGPAAQLFLSQLRALAKPLDVDGVGPGTPCGFDSREA